MNCSFATETRLGTKAEKLSSNQVTIENNKQDKGLSFLKKGQRITGVVTAVDKQVTLNFSGQEITASKSILSDAKPGDVKNFEVVKATDTEIELRLLEDKFDNSQKTFKATVTRKSDWDSILDQKEKAAKRVSREIQYKDTHSKLDEINSKLTELDCKHLEEEGFPIEGYTIDGLYEALNRVKSEVGGTNQSKTETMASLDETALEDRLKKENLPVTSENLTKLSKALELVTSLSKMDDKAMQYLISTDAEPSVENIYKACYSGSAQNLKNTPKLSENAWNELENQVKEVIKSAGYEVNEDNLEDAKWLIENQIPLTLETFTYKKNLEEIKSDSDKDTLLNKMISGMKNGTNPKDVSLLFKVGTSTEQIMADINAISEDAIDQAVKEDKGITIKKLVTIEESLSSGKKAQTEEVGAFDKSNTEKAIDPDAENSDLENSDIDAAGVKEYQYEELKAKRQLEEIRLKMTLEAANQLEKKGFSIETEQLGKVVEALKDLEDNYYKNLFKEADTEASEQYIQTLKETTQSIELLKNIPCGVLGNTLSTRNIQTITGLLTEGSKLQADYTKAGTAYETLATVPNSEYKDSIKKAFANADSLLSQMDLDNTEQNRRAIRILGYNQMEITKESINQVKAYDQQVSTMIQNLHPAVTVRMIKDGINPMEMPINELNSSIDKMKEEQGITSEDKYSTYLNKLEKEKGITGEERKAYIGIYRLLYNVDKSDGAALGAVIKADREVTLGSLLTAVQTSKKGSIDAIVNDEFGTLQSITHNKETIAEQLSSFSNQSNQNDSAKEQTEYLNRILKQIKDELSPEKLMETGSSLSQTNVTDSQNSAGVPLLSSKRGIWDTIKEVPIEKLLEELRNTDNLQTSEDKAYSDKVQEIRELSKNCEQSIRFLNDFRIPSTSLNIMLANHILSNGESPIKKLLYNKKENIVENSENSLKEMNDLSDTLIDKHKMEKVYEQCETDAKAALSQACSAETIDSRKLAELKSLGQQMTFIKTLAQKEFYQIPIETNKGITNMNLTIVRGTETAGKVSVNVWSEQLGNVKAEFILKDQVLKGFFCSDNKDGLEQLQSSTVEIENAAQENNVIIKQMDFGVQRRENDNYSYQNLNNELQSSFVTNDTERILYRIAKAVVQTVRRAENSGSDLEQAVS
ncbi:MAG: DUF6240 domain-containing protein [Herbinix sp.]|nr:DUF6240 domain-containing protein [Herbinix sp.]